MIIRIYEPHDLHKFHVWNRLRRTMDYSSDKSRGGIRTGAKEHGYPR